MAATRNRWMARFSALILGAFGCLFLAALVPMITGHGNVERVGSGSRVEAASLDTFSITNPITLSTSPLLRLERGTVSIDRSGAIKGESPRLLLDHAHFTVTANRTPPFTGSAAPSNSDVELPNGDIMISTVARALTGLGFDKLSIRRGSLSLGWIGNDTPTLKSLDVKNITANVAANRKGIVTIQGEGELFGERVSLDSALSTTAEATTTTNLRRALKLSLKAPALQVDFDGRLESGSTIRLNGQMDATVTSASKLAQWLSVPVPDSPVLRDLHVRGQVDWSNAVLAVDKASISIQRQSPATGAFSISFDASRPVINATLAYDTFDIGTLVTAGLPETAKADTPDKSWRSMTSALPHIRFVDADLRVSANSVRLGDRQLGRGAASLGIKSGKMTVDIAELANTDDRLSAQIAVDMTQSMPCYTLRGKLETLNLAPHLHNEALPGFVSGKGELLFDLKGEGETLEQVISVAAGKLAIRAGAGTRSVIDTRALKTAADHHARSDAKKPPAFTTSPVLTKSPQAVDGIDARINMSGYLAMVEQATIRQAGLVTQLSGWVDLVSRDLTLNAVQTPAPGLSNATAKKLTQGESNSFEVKGLWSDLSVRRLNQSAAQP